MQPSVTCVTTTLSPQPTPTPPPGACDQSSGHNCRWETRVTTIVRETGGGARKKEGGREGGWEGGTEGGREGGRY